MNYKIESNVDHLARRDYEQARSRAFWRKIRSMVGRECNDLLPSEQVLENLHNQTYRNLGLQQVAIERIVGSGRYRDFDRGFFPLRQEGDGRWQSIASARRQGIKLPPPLLYQVGDAYIVEDGNHRISAARAAGQETIEANVIAFDISNLTADSSCTRLGYQLADRGCSNAQQ